jgi:hypothetical protein
MNSAWFADRRAENPANRRSPIQLAQDASFMEAVVWSHGMDASMRMANITRSSLWLFASLVPLALLAQLFVLTSYAGPESDDYCFLYRSSQLGIIGTVWHFHATATGRISSSALTLRPHPIGELTGLDITVCYVLTLLALQMAFAAAALAFSFRLWARASLAAKVWFAAAFLATAASQAATIREMLYWLNGVACYMIPSAIVVLMLAEFVRKAETGAGLSRPTVAWFAVGSFIAATCNEYTAIWIFGLVAGSLLTRWCLKHDSQIKEHAIIGAAALFGFLIVLVAPGNSVRMSHLPEAGQFWHSAIEALHYARVNFVRHAVQPATAPWLVLVALFALMQPEQQSDFRQRRLLATAIVIFCLGCGYFAYFTHQYATGVYMVERAQNQVMVFVLAGLTIAAALLAEDFRRPLRRYLSDRIGLRRSLVLAPMIFLLFFVPLYYSKTSSLLRAERDSFRTFWLESIQRHTLLSFSTEQDLVVAKHRSLPTVLAGSDVTDDPDRLPNDCIAGFYGKRSVIAGPPQGLGKSR